MGLVMIVEDNTAYRTFLVQLVTADGHEALTAADGVQALEKIKTKRNGKPIEPDLVLIDYNMDKMNGFELINRLRTTETTRKTPIVMISGTEKNLGPVLAMEGVKFVRKLSQTNEILNAIREHVAPNAPPPAAHSAKPSNGSAAVETAPAVPAAKTEAEIRAEEALQAAEKEEADLKLKELMVLSSEITPLTEAKEEEKEHSHEDQSQMIRLVDGILVEAIRRKASDIHVQPQEDALYIRYRIDGQLQQVLTLPIAFKANIPSRLKVMSGMNVAEKRLPQDGRFSMKTESGQRVEFRVNTLPSQHGEKVVMRLLRHEKISTPLKDIFTRPRDLEAVETALKAPTGLILVTGPTGSGKTTTLYAMLDVVNKPTRNIITVEDPVENEVAGITQVPVRADIGFTFEKVLRSCLRQDPNIIMVGEIRDTETAEIAMKAAMTGHLVLSTLHTNTAPLAIYRLSTMGVKPFLIVAALKVAIAQRLIRLLCPHCKVQAPLDEELASQLAKEERKKLAKVFVKGPKGCDHCDGVGYKGRKAVLEVMTVKSHETRQLIMEAANPDKILERAKADGMVPLRDGAIDLVAQGLTSLEEAFTIYYVD